MTSTTAPKDAPVLAELVSTVRDAVRLERPPAETARLVAERIEPFLSQPDLLPDEYREGDPDRYRQHIVHAEEDGSFSVVALVWGPGQQTPVHDHLAWCVTGVCEGAETERRYELRGAGDTTRLVAVADTVNNAGTACGFAPPGDIHLVRNTGDSTVISIHVYGADISKLGTSIRRLYDLPVEEA
ncbi:cysteine dioxygenase family protein [Saccharopolyspora shandongensis]|uniref:cysteine dioxygenase family protein n=1 Tax=Saccharopolyspora shandongensis TaxID=418495 RepID=UPI00343027C6